MCTGFINVKTNVTSGKTNNISGIARMHNEQARPLSKFHVPYHWAVITATLTVISVLNNVLAELQFVGIGVHTNAETDGLVAVAFVVTQKVLGEHK
jgi:hypothetical protein